MNRKIEQAKKKRAIQATQQELTAKEIEARQKLLDATEGLYELINGQEQYDFDKLHKQLVEIDKRLDLAPLFKSLEKSIKDISQPATDKTKIEGFSELLKAVKTNKPMPVKVDLTKLEKAIVEIQQRIEDNSKSVDQDPESYQPVRRVVKMGNRFFYDDILTPSAGTGGGGGSSSGGLTDAELRASPVPVTASIDTTGLATSTKQSDGTQKTQIVDNGGSIAADVLDLTNSNPLTTALVDANGDQITSFGGGTQYTEDAVAAADPVGTALNMVRDDARGGGLTTADGDNVAARGNNKGELYVKATDTDALLTTIDADTGTIATEVAGLLTDTELRATPVPVSVSGVATAAAQTDGTAKIQIVDAGGDAVTVTGGKLDVNSAAPVGGATEAKQDSQITLATQLETLTETLQELSQRLTPLAGAMNNTAQLRTVVTGAVTATGGGYITSAQEVAALLTQSNTLISSQRLEHNNLLPTTANINNAVAA